MIGNDCTGDLTALMQVVDISGIDDNWVTGKIRGTNLTVQMKVFSESSTFGIGDGRISKMSIYNDADRQTKGFFGACEMNYDRGWDIKPATDEAFERCQVIVNALGAKMDIRRKKVK